MKSTIIARFFTVEEGVTAVEYAILIMLIVLAISYGVSVLGTTAFGVFDSTSAAIP